MAATIVFTGGAAGPWRVTRSDASCGDPLPAATHVTVRLAAPGDPEPAGAWTLRGSVSNLRYATRAEAESLRAVQPPLDRPASTCAALIPIRKSPAWWDLAQDERRAIFEETSHHTQIGLGYLPAVARRLHHARDLGEPFDFLTWFEFAPEHAADFDRLVAALRATREWRYVERRSISASAAPRPGEAMGAILAAGFAATRAAQEEPSDAALLPRLRAGEAAAFRILVRRYHVRLVAVARGARLSHEAAEEAVQEAWIAAMRNVGGFEGRSSLRTWLTGIVLNIARSSSARGRRTATFAELSVQGADGEEAGFDADAFLADGHWREAPWHWSEIDLERGLAGRQLWGAVEAAIAGLPEAEAAVIRLRDVEGFGVRETEELLGLGEARQRALLDRARLKVRRVFEGLTRETGGRAEMRA